MQIQNANIVFVAKIMRISLTGVNQETKDPAKKIAYSWCSLVKRHVTST